MNRKEIEEKVLIILRDQTGAYEDIQLETKLQDEAGFDSLDALEVMMTIEMRFGMFFGEDISWLEKVRDYTAKDVIDKVEELLKTK